MNLFDTEHPLNSRRTRASFWNSRAWSFLQAVFGLALILFPVLVGLIWYLDGSDNNTTPAYDTEPFWAVALAAAMGSFIISIFVVLLFWLGSLLLRMLRKRLLPSF
jgi:hypothetical protein